jgi:phytanoyl-CoA hydroxylase
VRSAESSPTVLVSGAADIDLEAALASFAAHGYARLGKVLDDDAMEGLRARADDIMLGRVVYPGLFFQQDTTTGRYDDLEFGKGWTGPSRNYRKIEKLEKDPLFLGWIQNALFGRVARAVVSDAVTIYRAVLFSKAASGGTVLPWHQDGGRFWGLDRDPVLQIWTALDDAPAEAGCVEVLPGSHLGGLATPLGGLVPAPIVSARDAEPSVVALPARAGEAILIHNHLWHRSGVNATGAPRRAFTVCYMDAATRCLRRKRAPREFVRVF